MVRKPVVAGTFYPSGQNDLRNALTALFRGAGKETFSAVVSPHAGYQYSGRTAALAISSLKPAKSFIILGPNHNLIGPEFSIMSSESWHTPLGTVEIDTSLAQQLKKCPILEEDSLAHAHEHSIEVQLPFLQHKFKNFRFVPISISGTDYSEEFLEKCVSLGKHIATVAKGDIGIIASSDFSHYLPVSVADNKDTKAFAMIEKLDVNGFFNALEKTGASVCGYAPIAVVMSAAKASGLKKAILINKTNSGDATGDYSSVVAYYAIGFK
ncbi:MAG: AmmeMemoRadiSam system protein B [Candidatus Aenigmarchaeota archaeon]|nr:AmmeMemoRadiSam system protein B [Candidatus Aenigmarchaeota archaeon]